MPKITDCLKAEREAAGNVIRLVRNNNFLRAYNRSAGHLPIIDDYEQWKEQIPLS